MSNNKVLLLCYHRVNSLMTDINMLAVSPYQFRQHMFFLKNNYIISRFEDDWSLLDGPGVVVTFDDGYLDNLQNALPILEELDVPATVFVSTGTMSQKRELWWDELEYLLFSEDKIPDKFYLEDELYGYEWRTDTYEMRLNCYRSLHFLMKNCVNVQKRSDWIKQLWNWRQKIPAARQTHLTLSDDDCIKLAESKLITIGGHTVSHPSLRKLAAHEQRWEIEESINYLSKLLSKEVNVFSYPFGAPDLDCDQRTADICRNVGIKKAVTTQKGVWSKEKGNYAIPRNCVRNLNIFEFKKMIESLWKE